MHCTYVSNINTWKSLTKNLSFAYLLDTYIFEIVTTLLKNSIFFFQSNAYSYFYNGLFYINLKYKLTFS